jgi:tryptophan halogenase
MIQNVVVLGAGSAGLLAAVTLKRKLPGLAVTVLRSPDIGTIGVGEGTTPNFVAHFMDFLGVQPALFHRVAEPTWKLGIRFLWGPRDHFDYSFAPNLDSRWSDLPRSNGYYLEHGFDAGNQAGALMSAGKAFTRLPDGSPDMQPWFAYHIENHKLIALLEMLARDLGVELLDARVTGVERGPAGVAALACEDGRRFAADLFIDASGFRSELLGKALEEPFVPFSDSLFCDRAVVGGWERREGPVLPYTTAETMDAGWCWRIDHEHQVNRGYVYSSAAISDDDAAAEFLRKNPAIPTAPRVVRFRSGYHRRAWVDNVVAIGNAAGFVEPLEATALMLVCNACMDLARLLDQIGTSPTPSMQALFNTRSRTAWEEIRGFLALHYKFNTRLDTPFWQHCRGETDVSSVAGLLEFYRENGPSGFGRHLLPATTSDFGIEGYLAILVGNAVPHRNLHRAGPAELARWERHREDHRRAARSGVDVREALACIRHPAWQWSRARG